MQPVPRRMADLLLAVAMGATTTAVVAEATGPLPTPVVLAPGPAAGQEVVHPTTTGPPLRHIAQAITDGGTAPGGRRS